MRHAGYADCGNGIGDWKGWTQVRIDLLSELKRELKDFWEVDRICGGYHVEVVVSVDWFSGRKLSRILRCGDLQLLCWSRMVGEGNVP